MSDMIKGIEVFEGKLITLSKKTKVRLVVLACGHCMMVSHERRPSVWILKERRVRSTRDGALSPVA